MISNRQFRKYIIKPTLVDPLVWTAEAEEILVATMAHESLGGTYLVQETAEGNRVVGGAVGIYQIQKATYGDVIKFIKNNPKYNAFTNSTYESMIYDLEYATYIARLNYMRFPGALPPANDIDGIWEYYKRFWNPGGKATRETFVSNYHRFVGAKV